MNLTPLDIRKQQFKKSLQGYNTEEVNAFLEMSAEEFETVIRKYDELKSKLADTQERLGGYLKIDRDLRDTMMMVNKLQETTKAEMKREAELVIQNAEKEAGKLIQSHRDQQQKLIGHIEQLKADQEALELKLKAMARTLSRVVEIEEKSGDELKLDLDALANADEKTLLQNRMNLLQDVRRLQKEKQAYLARLKSLLEMQQKMLEL